MCNCTDLKSVNDDDCTALVCQECGTRWDEVRNSVSKPHFTSTHWANWVGCVFLGTEKNPKTGRVYDYWIVNTGGNESAELSWTAKHGEEDCEYGSGPIKFMGADDFSLNSVKHMEFDLIYGCMRAKYFALLYLATKNLPLIED